MRTLRQAGEDDPRIVHNTNYTKFKQGTLQNETDTQDGTPVVEQVYGDVLTNIYKLLEKAGVTPNNTQDSEDTEFQIVKALQNLPNELNDIEKVLSLSENQWSVTMSFENLPDKYFFFARAAENYSNGANYTIKGLGERVFNFSSTTGFNSSDEILVILDSNGARAISLTSISAESDEVFTVFGNPLAFNDTSLMYYESDGNLVTDLPSINNLQSVIRSTSSSGTILVYEILLLNGYALCFTFDPSNDTYQFYQFDINALGDTELVTVSGVSFPNTQNNQPYVFTDGSSVFVTNSSNNSDQDNLIDKFNYNPTTRSLIFSQTITLGTVYSKTTNTVIKGDSLFTFVDGRLYKHTLLNGSPQFVGQYNVSNGIIFCFNSSIYFTNGGVAKKWTL